MSTAADILADAFGRIGEGAEIAVDGLSPEDLAHRIAPDANTIGWLVWHLLRVQDAQIADVAGTDEVWTSAGWQQRFGLPFDAAETGYGQSSDEVGAVTTTSELLVGYARAVTQVTQEYVNALSNDDLDRIVDESWDPPVTLAVRLVSILDDDLKHLGQAEYVKGLL
ncbi:mycothiol transferase [Aeromicrobium chenweiae]|uniref:Uncharacterized protein n=1 Tax=Aeromicrobium chenweiae TaxID=2079793 RepID=A0A2S0WRL7_9ACTN|nr:DUF664 domain-containing protein [Aeromicrobium chenweiae]AWB93962.1 hypothetical protein C3E78_00210 [Aeromicrobium chenweiae]TGN31042.1 DUF664 domain-containing protein [Aeromicrobium chenweiae]